MVDNVHAVLGQLQQLGLTGADQVALVEAAPILAALPLEERAQPVLAVLMERGGLSASEVAKCVVRTKSKDHSANLANADAATVDSTLDYLEQLLSNWQPTSRGDSCEAPHIGEVVATQGKWCKSLQKQHTCSQWCDGVAEGVGGIRCRRGTSAVEAALSVCR